MSELVLHTALPPSRRLRIQTPPYRHVVGIEVVGGELWRSDRSSYGETQAEPISAADAQFAERLFRFFEAYFDPRLLRRPECTCHIFAAIMTDLVEIDFSRDETWDESIEIARAIVANGKSVEELAFGVDGVVGQRAEPRCFVSHSAIGLGGGECLEVDDVRGDLGIQQCSRNIEYYRSWETTGMYALQGASTALPR